MRFSQLVIKVMLFIQDAKQAGVIRTRLMQKFSIRAATLNKALEGLLADHIIIACEEPVKQYSLGRVPTRYFHKDHLPPDLTLSPADDISLPDSVIPTDGYTCRQCGRAMARVKNAAAGRPPVYCSPECKVAHVSQKGPMRTFLVRPMLPRIWAHVAVCLVVADVMIRGLKVAPFDPMTQWLFVYDDQKNAAPLYIFSVNEEGIIPDTNEYSSCAVVFRDGRIVYAGQHPLFGAEEQPEQAAPVDAVEPVNTEPTQEEPVT